MPMMPVLLYNSPIEKYRTLVIELKICLIKEDVSQLNDVG